MLKVKVTYVIHIGQGTSPPVAVEPRWAIQDTTKGKAGPYGSQHSLSNWCCHCRLFEQAMGWEGVAETHGANEISEPITTFISSNPGPEVGSVILNATNQRKMLVPTYYMDAEELEDQPVSPVKVVGHENFRVAMGMDYDAESWCKQSDHDDNGYVTSSKVEDFNDGYEDHNLHFWMWPAEDVCIKMTNDGKKVKVDKDVDQEMGQASSMMTKVKASKQKGLPSVLTEDWV
ncbi:hypothetical protein EDC04DRAFT_2602058 [Pisolithus marmoratus]|nr:hypothetical protein EDC04DRAFT_2602058 [Pisolithus marmoratus]